MRPRLVPVTARVAYTGRSACPAWWLGPRGGRRDSASARPRPPARVGSGASSQFRGPCRPASRTRRGPGRTCCGPGCAAADQSDMLPGLPRSAAERRISPSRDDQRLATGPRSPALPDPIGGAGWARFAVAAGLGSRGRLGSARGRRRARFAGAAQPGSRGAAQPGSRGVAQPDSPCPPGPTQFVVHELRH
jgi:hypothetical protein